MSDPTATNHDRFTISNQAAVANVHASAMLTDLLTKPAGTRETRYNPATARAINVPLAPVIEGQQRTPRAMKRWCSASQDQRRAKRIAPERVLSRSSSIWDSTTNPALSSQDVIRSAGRRCTLTFIGCPP